MCARSSFDLELQNETDKQKLKVYRAHTWEPRGGKRNLSESGDAANARTRRLQREQKARMKLERNELGKKVNGEQR